MPRDNERRGSETADQRKARLAAELRSNLAKRKAQARARAASGADDANSGQSDPGRPTPRNHGIASSAD